jgi:uncharacterized iron-regulated membrane protein
MRRIHLWLGLGLLALVVPLGLSGSLLVWDIAVDKLAHRARYAVGAGELSPEIYLAAARTAFAGRAAPAQLRMPRGAGMPVTVVGYTQEKAAPGQRPPMRTAWLDPATGRLLDEADPRGEWLGLAHRLHGNLLLTEIGRPIVGWLGVAMLAMSLTGLWVWWPRAVFLRGLRWARSRSTMSNLHHAVGFWIAIPLTVLSASGVYIAFPRTLQALTAPQRPLALGQGPRGERAFAPPLPATQLTADAALAAARSADAALAQARLVTISLPTAADRKPIWRVQLQPAEGPAVSIQVGDQNAHPQARAGAPRDGPGAGDPFARLVREVHEGSAWGPAWRILATVTGLAPTILALSGVFVWLRRRRFSARST